MGALNEAEDVWSLSAGELFDHEEPGRCLGSRAEETVYAEDKVGTLECLCWLPAMLNSTLQQAPELV